MSNTNQEVPRKELVYVCHQDAWTNDDEMDLLELWSILWNGKWVILALTLVCTLGAFVIVQLLPSEYKSSATIRTTETSNKIISSFLQSDDLRQTLEKDYPQAGQTPYSLSVSEDDDLASLSLEWTCAQPSQCTKMLSAVLEEMTSYMRTEFVSTAREKIAIWKEELNKVQQQLSESQAQTAKSPNVIADIAVMHSKIAELRSEDLEARKFTIVNRPSTPRTPTKPNKELIVILTCVASLFMAVFVVFIRSVVLKARHNMPDQRHQEGGGSS